MTRRDRLDDIAIQRELGRLPGWIRRGDALVKTFAFPSYLAGVPDEFQRLWTPHRMVYIQQGDPGHDDCPFCVAPSMSDEDALIVARGTHAELVDSSPLYRELAAAQLLV